MDRLNRFHASGVAIVSAAASAALIVSIYTWSAHAPALSPAASERLQGDLADFAREPRSLGSPGHARAVKWLVERAKGSGAAVSVTRGLATRTRRNGSAVAAAIENVVAVVQGSRPERALLVMGHYDSVPNSPGASDNGATVVSMFAAMDALSRRQPRNDVIFLFSDAEELGLLGAKDFFDHDPRAKRVAAVLNFDSRGASGPSLLFETGVDNGFLVRAFAQAAPMPLGTSLGAEIYRFLPNDTDFSAARERRIPGLNFANIGGFVRYHTTLDDVHSADPTSVRQRAGTLVCLTRTLAAADLANIASSSVSYFSFAPGIQVRWPLSLSRPLAALTAVFLCVIIGLKRRTGAIRLRHTAMAGAAVLLAIAAGGLLSAGLWIAVHPLRTVSPLLPQNGGYRGWLYLCSGALIVCGAVVGLLGALGSRIRRLELMAGAAGFWAVVGLSAGWVAPGATYFFVLPALVAGISALESDASQTSTGRARLVRCLAVALVVMTTVPVIWLLYLAIGPVGFSVALALASAVCILVVPLAVELTRRQLSTSSAVSVCCGVVLLLVARVGDRSNPEHPRPDGVMHLTNTDLRRSVWATNDLALDSYTAGVLGPNRTREPASPFLPELSREIWTAPTPYTPALTLSVHSESADPATPGIRRIVLHAGAATDVVDLRFGQSTRVERLTVDRALPGVDISAPSGWLQLWAPGASDVVIEVRSPPGAPIQLSVVARSFSPELLARMGAPVRPQGTMPIPIGFGPGDIAVVRTDYRF